MSKREKEATPRNSSTLLNSNKSVCVLVRPQGSWDTTPNGTVTRNKEANSIDVNYVSELKFASPYGYEPAIFMGEIIVAQVKAKNWCV